MKVTTARSIYIALSSFLFPSLFPAALVTVVAFDMPPLSPTPPRAPNLRIELFFKNPDELRERVRFLSEKYGIASFNLVNKSNKDAAVIQEWIRDIRDEIPESDVSAHYSLKFHKCRKKDGAFGLLSDFVRDVTADGNEVLLVTGSGPKGALDAVAALRRLQREGEGVRKTPAPTAAPTSSGCVAVAYNPFFPSARDAEVERDRLREKIRTRQVGKVYLQFGTDLEKLRSALDWLTALRQEDARGETDGGTDRAPAFSVCGSIFLPTRKLIAQQKFRPWNGVFLSDKFLASEDGARSIVVEMMRLYEERGCEILIEAPGVRNEKDMDIVEGLLRDRDNGRNIDASARNDEVDANRNVLATTDTDANSELKTKNEREKTVSANTVVTKRRKVEPLHRAPRSLSSSPLVQSEALRRPAVLLFGSHDVRLHDNVALQLASFHSIVIPVFIWSRKEQGKWGVRGATEVVLKDALRHLHSKLEGHGSRLICREAEDSSEGLKQLCVEMCVGTVYLNKEHVTESRVRERRHREHLQTVHVQVIECQSSLLYDPTSASLSAGFSGGGHWGTLMPFLKGCKKQLGEPRRPIPRSREFSIFEGLKGPDVWPNAIPVDELDMALVKGTDQWHLPILSRFPMSEDDAVSNMDSFFSNGYERYEQDRSRADMEGSTSKLSAHLRIGTISPNELYYRIEDSGLDYEHRKTISRRLFWRDLAYFQLLNFPNMRDRSIRSHYEGTEWVTGEEESRRVRAWQEGRTGYPLVDAGMRELYATGWMTQSIRMVAASFLTEYLRVDWARGCAWFHDTLVDADSAINAMMWQNAGRSGIDQWNFVMSPTAASQDRTGAYTKKWVPELAELSAYLHTPWDAPAEALRRAGVVLGETYPHRIVVDLKAERQRSVANVLAMRRENQQHNDERGYDLVALPDGKQTVVFTLKMYRIDREGRVIQATAKRKSKPRVKQTSGRGQRGRSQSKLKT